MSHNSSLRQSTRLEETRPVSTTAKSCHEVHPPAICSYLPIVSLSEPIGSRLSGIASEAWSISGLGWAFSGVISLREVWAWVYPGCSRSRLGASAHHLVTPEMMAGATGCYPVTCQQMLMRLLDWSCTFWDFLSLHTGFGSLRVGYKSSGLSGSLVMRRCLRSSRRMLCCGSWWRHSGDSSASLNRVLWKTAEVRLGYRCLGIVVGSRGWKLLGLGCSCWLRLAPFRDFASICWIP